MMTGILKEEKKVFVKAFNLNRENALYVPHSVSKDKILSEEARLFANELYQRENHTSESHKLILSEYSYSIALAPPMSEEQALGYGNRSALLLHLSKFKESIQDIDRALSITRSNVLKIKLLCRKVECLSACGDSEKGTEIIFRKAKNLWNSCKKNEKKILVKLLDKAESCLKQKNTIRSDKNIKKSDEEKNSDSFCSVSVVINDDKFGNHLIATKDISPGEVIFIEKPYTFTFYAKNQYIHCSRCFNFSWATIPCDTCHISMYCSPECREKAWTEYHDVECSVLSSSFTSGNYIILGALRALILGLKEAGSIEKLKSSLQNLEKDRGIYLKKTFGSKSFHRNGFKSLYNLSSEVPQKAEQFLSQLAVLLLISLVKFSKLFNKRMSPEDWLFLIHDDNALFIGALILKIMKIYTLSHNARLNQTIIQSGLEIEEIGSSMSFLYGLMNHSCYPNANVCYTENNKTILYAVQPIKKNMQIFVSYMRGPSDWPIENSTRKFIFFQQFGFVCDCIACKNKWPQLLRVNDSVLFRNTEEYLPSLREMEIFHKFKIIFELVHCTDDTSKLDKRIIPELAKGIELVEKQLAHPTHILPCLVQTLIIVFHKLHQTQPVPKECRKR